MRVKKILNVDEKTRHHNRERNDMLYHEKLVAQPSKDAETRNDNPK